jgi:zinc/manganese transport system substrate-binding protein
MSRRAVLHLAAIAAALLMFGGPVAGAAEKLRVVASFSILADMVANVGGGRVAITTLVRPDADAHVYEPSPADARAVAEAALVFVNGLGFEGWLKRLVTASGYAGPVVVASDGVAGLAAPEEHAEGHDGTDADPDEHEGGATDPHAWQDLANARIYVENIRVALIEADPGGADVYSANAAAYLAQIDELEKWVRAELGELPEDRRTIVTSHDAFGYFAAAYDLRFVAPAGLSTDAEPSAAAVAALIRQLKEQSIRAVFLENISNPRLLEQIGRESGAVVGGTLYSDALSRRGGPADSYLKMFRYNVGQIKDALS